METDFPVLGVDVENVFTGARKLKSRYTVDEYLALERAAEERHIYLDGEIFAMAGESDNHGDVSVNTVVSLGMQLKDKPCRVRTKQTAVRSGMTPMSGHSTKGMFSYPDILVICGEIEHHDAHKDIILNPKVIIEVLSPSTEGFDRGDKFTRFQTCIQRSPTTCSSLRTNRRSSTFKSRKTAAGRINEALAWRPASLSRPLPAR